MDPIDAENCSSMEANAEGDFDEGLLAKSAAESPRGPGGISRRANRAIVDMMQPLPDSYE